MRDLDFSELQFVSGAGSAPSGPSSGSRCAPSGPSSRRMKNNNGCGNGADGPYDNPAPGRSGRTGGGKDENRLGDRDR